MENRKRRIDQLLGHLENKLDTKRRKLNRLQDELNFLESEGLLLPEHGLQSNAAFSAAFEQSTPVSGKKFSSIFSKHVETPPTQHDESSLLSSKLITEKIDSE